MARKNAPKNNFDMGFLFFKIMKQRYNKNNTKMNIVIAGWRFGSFDFALAVGLCGWGQRQMCQMWDSQTALPKLSAVLSVCSSSCCVIVYGERSFFRVATNVSGLCDGGAIEAQIFNFAQKLNRRTTVELCSFAPLSQNPCACCTTQIYKKLV